MSQPACTVCKNISECPLEPCYDCNAMICDECSWVQGADICKSCWHKNHEAVSIEASRKWAANKKKYDEKRRCKDCGVISHYPTKCDLCHGVICHDCDYVPTYRQVVCYGCWKGKKKS